MHNIIVYKAHSNVTSAFLYERKKNKLVFIVKKEEPIMNIMFPTIYIHTHIYKFIK